MRPKICVHDRQYSNIVLRQLLMSEIPIQNHQTYSQKFRLRFVIKDKLRDRRDIGGDELVIKTEKFFQGNIPLH